jgi:hypothetical protein
MELPTSGSQLPEGLVEFTFRGWAFAACTSNDSFDLFSCDSQMPSEVRDEIVERVQSILGIYQRS